MDAAGARGMELLGGRWRRPILDAGVTRGVCEALVSGPASAVRVARALAGEAGLRAWRLRALGSWGRWREDQARTVALTPRGERRCWDHPRTRRGITRRLEGPEHDAAWKHRPALSTAGPPHAVGRACGPPPVDSAVPPPSDGAVCHEAMSRDATRATRVGLDAVAPDDVSGRAPRGDGGGGHGSPLGRLLVTSPHRQGTGLAWPRGIAPTERLGAGTRGVGARCPDGPGDLVQAIPPAEASLVQRLLQDGHDAACRPMRAALPRAAPPPGRGLILAPVVPSPDTPHVATLGDRPLRRMHTGRARPLEDDAGRREGAGWTDPPTWSPASTRRGGVEGVPAATASPGTSGLGRGARRSPKAWQMPTLAVHVAPDDRFSI
jgi:hypothetical protein